MMIVIILSYERKRQYGAQIIRVMAGQSRLKDGVASARLCPAIHVFLAAVKSVDARHKDRA
jgi:hypothetical protein